MTLRDKLIRDARAFADANGISKARLATIVVNNGKFFKNLGEGSDCTTGVFERFQTVFNDSAAWEAAKAADRERRNRTSWRCWSGNWRAPLVQRLRML